MASPKYSLDKGDFKKIGKGAVIAVVGAVTSYVVTAGLPTEGDKASWVAFVSAVSAVAFNALWKFLSDNPPALSDGEV